MIKRKVRVDHGAWGIKCDTVITLEQCDFPSKEHFIKHICAHGVSMTFPSTCRDCEMGGCIDDCVLRTSFLWRVRKFLKKRKLRRCNESLPLQSISSLSRV